uniref:Uncharacterized protein n=1 Tax=Cacopsylla melanoneura TaxID=428564 RepID=A0A8D8PUB1_9HEMI
MCFLLPFLSLSSSPTFLFSPLFFIVSHHSFSYFPPMFTLLSSFPTSFSYLPLLLRSPLPIILSLIFLLLFLLFCFRLMFSNKSILIFLTRDTCCHAIEPEMCKMQNAFEKPISYARYLLFKNPFETNYSSVLEPSSEPSLVRPDRHKYKIITTSLIIM